MADSRANLIPKRNFQQHQSLPRRWPEAGLVRLWPDRSLSSHRRRRKGDLDRCRVGHDNWPVPRRTTRSPSESVPVGAAEIAVRLRVRPQTVHTWRHRKLMPEPRWTVSGQPAWDWPEIEAWARRTGRLREGDVHVALLELDGVGWEGNLDELRSHRASRRCSSSIRQPGSSCSGPRGTRLTLPSGIISSDAHPSRRPSRSSWSSWPGREAAVSARGCERG